MLLLLGTWSAVWPGTWPSRMHWNRIRRESARKSTVGQDDHDKSVGVLPESSARSTTPASPAFDLGVANAAAAASPNQSLAEGPSSVDLCPAKLVSAAKAAKLSLNSASNSQETSLSTHSAEPSKVSQSPTKPCSSRARIAGSSSSSLDESSASASSQRPSNSSAGITLPVAPGDSATVRASASSQLRVHGRDFSPTSNPSHSRNASPFSRLEAKSSACLRAQPTAGSAPPHASDSSNPEERAFDTTVGFELCLLVVKCARSSH